MLNSAGSTDMDLNYSEPKTVSTHRITDGNGFIEVSEPTRNIYGHVSGYIIKTIHHSQYEKWYRDLQEKMK